MKLSTWFFVMAGLEFALIAFSLATNQPYTIALFSGCAFAITAAICKVSESLDNLDPKWAALEQDQALFRVLKEHDARLAKLEAVIAVEETKPEPVEAKHDEKELRSGLGNILWDFDKTGNFPIHDCASAILDYLNLKGLLK